MRYKPELLTTAGSLEQVASLVRAGADAVQIGEQRYGMRLPGDIGRAQLKEAVHLARTSGPSPAKVYVVANAIMENADLPELPDYLKAVAEAGADAVVFGDPAILLAARDAGVRIPFHWNPEMTATNYVSANYWGTKGVTRAILARELNLEQVLEFKRSCLLEVQVQVHGMTNIFHSKRRMVTNYYDHRKKEAAGTGRDRGLFLIEEERRDERYPIYEDAGGTHIMSSEDLCMIENLHELMEGGIDSFKIEGLMKPSAYNEAVVRIYRQAVDAYAADPEGYSFRQEWLEEIESIQPEDRPLSYGFFYKEQVY